jgi:hypothetical protein
VLQDVPQHPPMQQAGSLQEPRARRGLQEAT